MFLSSSVAAPAALAPASIFRFVQEVPEISVSSSVAAPVALASASISRFVQEVPETSYSSSEDEDWFDTEDAAGRSVWGRHAGKVVPEEKIGSSDPFDPTPGE